MPETRLDKEGAAFVVRRLAPADRLALAAFYEAFTPKRAAQSLPPDSAVRIARWLDAVVPQGVHLVADRDGRLIGHCMLIPTRDARVAEYAVFVQQDVRDRGVGTEMNRAALEVARTEGFRRVWLTVEPGNRAAVRSYEKAGFRFLPGTILSVEAEMAVDLQTLRS